MILVQVQILSSIRSNRHMSTHDDAVVRTDYKLVRFNSHGKIVKSHSFNPLWTMITTMLQEKSNTWHISEPIIRRFFLQHLCHLTSFTSEQYHWFIQLWKETRQHFAKFWRLFRSVMWPILVPVLSLFSCFFFLLDFITITVVEFLIKQLFYSGLLDIEWL